MIVSGAFGPFSGPLDPHFSPAVGASGLRIGEISSAARAYRGPEKAPDADGV
jgi:hypothetical protein